MPPSPVTDLVSDSLRVAGMTSPLCRSRALAALGDATGRGRKTGLLSGRNSRALEDLDRQLIGPRDRFGLEPPELRLERRQVLDRAIDRREHDGGHAVQPREPAKRQLTHPF